MDVCDLDVCDQEIYDRDICYLDVCDLDVCGLLFVTKTFRTILTWTFVTKQPCLFNKMGSHLVLRSDGTMPRISYQHSSTCQLDLQQYLAEVKRELKLEKVNRSTFYQCTAIIKKPIYSIAKQRILLPPRIATVIL